MLSKKELDELCMKGESLRQRLCAVDNGRLIHEAGGIANILCNGVPHLQDGYKTLEKIRDGKDCKWTEDEAIDFCNRVESSVKKGIARAIKFLNANNL